ncbi:hypothetical protein FOBRF1_013618 [Fusarium oxysporum]
MSPVSKIGKPQQRRSQRVRKRRATPAVGKLDKKPEPFVSSLTAPRVLQPHSEAEKELVAEVAERILQNTSNSSAADVRSPSQPGGMNMRTRMHNLLAGSGAGRRTPASAPVGGGSGSGRAVSGSGRAAFTEGGRLIATFRLTSQRHQNPPQANGAIIALTPTTAKLPRNWNAHLSTDGLNLHQAEYDGGPLRFDLQQVDALGIQNLSKEERYYLLFELRKEGVWISCYVLGEPRTAQEHGIGFKKTTWSNAEVALLLIALSTNEVTFAQLLETSKRGVVQDILDVTHGHTMFSLAALKAAVLRLVESSSLLDTTTAWRDDVTLFDNIGDLVAAYLQESDLSEERTVEAEIKGLLRELITELKVEDSECRLGILLGGCMGGCLKMCANLKQKDDDGKERAKMYAEWILTAFQASPTLNVLPAYLVLASHALIDHYWKTRDFAAAVHQLRGRIETSMMKARDRATKDGSPLKLDVTDVLRWMDVTMHANGRA